MKTFSTLFRMALYSLFGCLALGLSVFAEDRTSNVQQKTETNCVGRIAGLVGWWPLDETSGTTAFDLVSGNAGGHQGGPLPSPAVVHGGLNFDGIDDRVVIPDASELNFGAGDFTLMAWVKTTQTAGVEVILDKRSFDFLGNGVGYELFLFNGRLALQLADGDFTNYISNVHVADGNFHHIAVTVVRDLSFPLNGIVFYVDGQSVATADPTDRQFSLSNDSPLSLGASSAEGKGFFDGILDEVALFNRALAANEVRDIHDARHAGVCKCAQVSCRPLAWWTFDENTGTEAMDIAGHTTGPHTGILQGPDRVFGMVGGALEFDELSDRFFPIQSAGLDLDLNRCGGFTAKAWIRTSSPSGPIVNNLGASNIVSDISFGWALSLEGGVPAFGVNTIDPQGFGFDGTGGACTSSACSGLNLADDQWHLVGATVVCDPGGKNLTIRLYADGELLQTFPAVDLLGNTEPGSVSIGHLSVFGFPEFFDGKIDEVQIFGQALTPTEFAQIFAAGSAGECKPPVPPQVCGLADSENCPAGQFCDFLEVSGCGTFPAGGICRPRPEACFTVFDPVCGCDGQTYSNRCFANLAGVSIAHSGSC